MNKDYKNLNNVETVIAATNLEKELKEHNLTPDDMLYFPDLFMFLENDMLPVVLNYIFSIGIPKEVFHSEHDLNSDLLDRILKMSDEKLAKFSMVYTNTVSSTFENTYSIKYPFSGIPLAQWLEIVELIRKTWNAIKSSSTNTSFDPYKNITCPWGSLHYKWLKNFIKRLNEQDGKYLEWKHDGMKTVVIEKGENPDFGPIGDYKIIFYKKDGLDICKEPWISFKIDDDRKMIIPSYIQNDDISYYGHVIDKNNILNKTVLAFADQSLHNCLLFIREWGIYPEDMIIH